MKEDKSSTIHELQSLMNGLKSEIIRLEESVNAVPTGIDLAESQHWKLQKDIEEPLLRMVRVIEKALPYVGGISKIKIK